MIEELKENPLHVCVCYASEKPTIFVAHCLELDLIGEGNDKQEAISRLKKTIEIQYRLCETREITFWVDDVDKQWIECHRAYALGNPENTTFTMEEYGKTGDVKAIRVPVKIDKTPRLLANKDSWCNEYPLHNLIKLLGSEKISWRTSGELDYGYFFGHWPSGSDGPLQSYPFYTHADTLVRWYHLRSIASRFWLDDLRLRLAQDN